MSKFISALYLIAASPDADDGKWILGADLVYDSDKLKQRITVPTGYQTDLASVPRLPVIYFLAGDSAHAAAVVHDFLYGGGVPGVSRKDADAVLREAATATGVPRWRSWLMWAGVRIGGGSHYTTAVA